MKEVVQLISWTGQLTDATVAEVRRPVDAEVQPLTNLRYLPLPTQAVPILRPTVQRLRRSHRTESRLPSGSSCHSRWLDALDSHAGAMHHNYHLNRIPDQA